MASAGAGGGAGGGAGAGAGEAAAVAARTGPEFSLLTTKPGPPLLQVHIAEVLTGCNLKAKFVAPGSLPLGATVALDVDGTTIAGANAIVRFLALTTKTKSLGAGVQGVEQWVAWEVARLAPIIQALRADGDKAAAIAQFDALMAQSASLFPEAANARLVGKTTTIADILIAADLLFASRHLDVTLPARIEAYAAGMKPTVMQGVAIVRQTIKKRPQPPSTLEGQLCELLGNAIAKAYPKADVSALGSLVTQAVAGKKFTHQYQCNAMRSVCVQLGMNGGQARAAATNVVAALAPSPVLGKVEVAGPGYINIHLAKPFVAKAVLDIVQNGVQPPKQSRKRHAIVDYSSPNIAKDMHVGHLRSTIIGDTICRFLEFVGHKVTRVNHVGDWGTQFGMLIAYMKREHPECADGKHLPNLADITQFYKASKKVFDADAEFKTKAYEEVVKLQSGDEVNLTLWRALVAKSAEMFEEVYKRLGVSDKLELCGESFYNPLIPGTIEELESKKLITKTADDGRSLMFVEGYEVPLICRKSDGGFGYDSTDLAAIKYRLQELKGDWLIYVVDNGQSLHFNLVFEGAQKAGWYDPESTRVEHVGFGVVCGADKKRLRTRDGVSTKLQDLLDTARDKALAELQKRQGADGDTATHVTGDLLTTAEELGYGSVKYFDLKQNRKTDYVFDYDRMLSANGDTAVYLQYMHARVCSILRKLGVDAHALLKADACVPVDLGHKSEMELACCLMRFQDAVEAVLAGLVPHRMCEYLYDLAGHFSKFFRDCRVLDNGVVNESRKMLVVATGQVMRESMKLIGLKPLDRI